MKRISTILFVLLVVGMLFFAAHPNSDAVSANQQRMVRQWEHMAMTVEGEKIGKPDVSRKIIEAGREGWELVDVETFVKAGDTNKVVYFFKRPQR